MDKAFITKKILSIFISLALLLSAAPFEGLAAETDVIEDDATAYQSDIDDSDVAQSDIAEIAAVEQEQPEDGGKEEKSAPEHNSEIENDDISETEALQSEDEPQETESFMFSLSAPMTVPALSTENNKRVYAVTAQASVAVSSFEGASVYYTIDGSEPTDSNGTSVSLTSGSGSFSVSAPSGADDGGIVTVKAVAITESESSEIVSLSLSFYRATEGSNDAITLGVGESVYYFETAGAAFAAVDDSNIQGDIILQVVGDEVSYTVGDNVSAVTMFSGATGTVTLDINGNNLHLVTGRTATGYSTTVNLNVSEFEIVDSKSMGTAVDNSGKENLSAGLTGGVLQLESIVLRLANQDEFTIQNIKVEALGSSPTRSIHVTDTTFSVNNVSVICNSQTSVTSPLLHLTGSDSSISNSVVKNITGAGGAAIRTGGSNLSLVNNTVESTSDAVYIDAMGTVTISGGLYSTTSTTTTYGAVKVNAASTTYLESGEFIGALRANISTAKLIMHGGYHKGSFTTTSTGYAAPEHCEPNEINEGKYAGFIHYTPRALHKSTVSVTDVSGNTFTAAAAAASANNTALQNLTDVWNGEVIIYTLTVMPDFAVTNIAYTSAGGARQSIALNDNVNYSVSEDGLIATYTMVVPDSDYTIEFQLSEQTEATAIIQVGNATYNSLSAAMAYLQDNATLKLLKDTTYNNALDFNKTGIVLDLNGHSLAMNVPEQLTEAGAINDTQTYSILLSVGSLTIKDTSNERDGVLSFGRHAGIRLAGNGTVFTLQSGTVQSISLSSNMCTINCVAANGTVNITGGLIDGRIWMNAAGSTLNFSGGKLETNYASLGITATTQVGAINITGGEIHSGPNISIVSNAVIIIGNTAGSPDDASAVVTTIGGTARIVTENASPAVRVAATSRGKTVINGDAQIIGESLGAALQIISATSAAGAVRSSVEIGGNAKLKGATYALDFQENANAKKSDGTVPMTPVSITGGYFACDEGYIPISDTHYVTFPAEKVLNTNAIADGDYAGYYSFASKESLSGAYTFGGVDYPYTYQDYHGISDGTNAGLSALITEATPIYTAGNTGYPPDSWNTFIEAFNRAKRVMEMNRNANQIEIDFRSGKLLAAIRALESASNLDVNNLADGKYSIDVETYKVNLSALSMSNGALDGPATLIIEDGNASLSVHLKPMFQYVIWGHLEDFFLWEGSTLAEARMSANSGLYNDSMMTKAAYSRFYYHHYSGENSAAFRADIDGTDEYSVNYPYPGTVTFNLPYLGIDEEHSMYLCYLVVDAMDSGASALLSLKWGTLTPIEIIPTLALDTDAVSLIAGGAQTVAAALKGADGYSAVAWASSDEGVATVADGTITAVAAGTAAITATASKDGETALTKTVAVAVAAENAVAASIEVEKNDTTVTATVSGDTLVTNGTGGEGIAVEKTKVTINATIGSSDGIATAAVVIPASIAGVLAGAEREVVIQTDMGDVRLTKEAVAQIASGAASGSATLTIAEASKPAGLEGTFIEYFDLSLTNSSGAAVTFSRSDGKATATVSVPCGSGNVPFAYYINNGKIAERQPVTLNDGIASWTTSHFSLWALSENTYTIDSGASDPGTGDPGAGDTPGSGFFLADGRYYVNIALWHEIEDRASMGNVAFANNSRALVTVSGGKITNVQVATNPVDVTNIHSAIIEFKVPGSSVTELETAPFTTRPAGKAYNYVKLAEFTMPDSGQPETRNQVTYVVVGFTVPDTPMDNAVDGPLTARLQFTWNTAAATSDARISANTSTAAGTAANIDTIDAPAVNLTDSATGIKLAAPESVVPTDAEFSVKTITGGADFTRAESALAEGANKFELFEISLVKNGAEVQPNGTVTISIPIPSDYDKAKVVFYRINDDATATLIKGKVSGSDYEVPLNHFSLYALAEGLEEVNDPEAPLADMAIMAFDDITGHWAYDYIRYVVERGLFTGVSGTRFDPQGTMTRGMFVTVLGRIAGIDAAEYTGGTFDDVDEGEYYAPYTVWASQNGIMAGVGGGRFAPGDAITREQMAAMLNNYAGFAGIALSTDAETPEFTDAAQISAWAADAVEAMAKAGIINGIGGGRFAPKNTATRAEVATLLARFLQGLPA